MMAVENEHIEAENVRLRQRIAELEMVVDDLTTRLTQTQQQLQTALLSKGISQTREERFRVLIEESVDAMLVCCDGIVCFANPAAVALFARPARNLVGSDLGIPVVAGEKTEISIVTPQGVHLVGEMRVMDIVWEGKTAALAVLRDITERKKTEEELKQRDAERTALLRHVAHQLSLELSQREETEKAILCRDAIFEAIEFASHRFLKTTSFEQEIPLVLEYFGKAISVSRLALYIKPGLSASSAVAPATPPQLAGEWMSPASRSHPPAIPWEHFTHWYRQMCRGQSIYGDVRTFPPSERTRLQALGIQSVVIVPIFVQHRWWGYLELDECNEKRAWTLTEVGALKAAASLIGSAYDHAQVLKALQESEERYRSMFENATIGVFRTTTSGRFLNVNPTLATILGYDSPQELIVSVTDIAGQLYVDPDFRHVVLDMLRQQHGILRNVQNRYYRRDGSQIITNLNLWTVRDEQGNVRYLEGFIEDITERVEAEEAYHAVVDYSLQGLAIFQDGRLVFANPVMESITGYTVEELQAMSPAEISGLIYPDDRPIVLERRQQRLSGKEVPSRYECRIIRRDGEIRWAEIAATVIHYRGRPASQAAFVDITERKRMQHALEVAAQQAEAMAQMKTAFLATMSHEIRTPLNAVIGMSALLCSIPLPEEPRYYVDIIHQSGNMLLKLVNDILDFSKIEAGRLEIEQVPFDLRSCVEEVLNLFASEAARKKLALTCFFARDIPTDLLGDITRVRQILMNLVSNAIKFTEAGEVVVTVERLERTTGDDGPATGDRQQTIAAARGMHTAERPAQQTVTFHVSVRDSGLGIPADQFNQLFQAFHQLGPSSSRKHGGTGLGLTISKQLAELMGGTIWVESEADQGSTFHVTFEAEVAPSQPRPFLERHQPDLLDKRLLIIEPQAANRLLLSQQAGEWGMQPVEAATLADGLHLLGTAAACEVVLLDMDGIMQEKLALELAQKIQQQCATQKVPLVLLSSPVTHREMAMHVSLPCAGWLMKPITIAPLHHVLVNIFRGVPLQTMNAHQESLFAEQIGKYYPLRILLAEDHIINQQVALALLEKLGYHADRATSGLEVLQMVEQQMYDVILMDVQMPEMDGMEATRYLRDSLPADQQPYVIALTAHALESDREHCLQAGMDDYLEKPLRIEDLVQKIQKIRPLADMSVPQGGTGDEGPETGDRHQTPVVPQHTPASQPAKQEMEPPAQSPLNVALYQQFCATVGAEAAAQLVDIFLQDVPVKVQHIRQALATNDSNAVRVLAHTLKSSSAQVGAHHVAALCKQLEHLARAATLDEAGQLLLEIEEAFGQARDAFRE
jgi:PAS domain S-box-containing protein